MKTQHLYFRYLSNMDLSITILFIQCNQITALYIFFEKVYSLHCLNVNMNCVQVLDRKHVI